MSDLTWQIIRNNSSFLRTQRGINKKFSREPFNLKGINSQRYNGLVNAKAIDIKLDAEKKALVVSTKAGHRQNPVKSVVSSTVSRKGRAILKAVRNVAKGYSPRLQKVAERRASQLLRSQQKKRVQKKKADA